MRRRSRATVLTCSALLVCCLLTPPAACAEEPPEPEEVAAEVRDVTAAGDTAKLATLAARKKPDPWLVADLLIEEGAIDMAIAFAEASKRPGTRGIVEYARARRGQPTTPAAKREALATARSGLEARDYQAMVDALADVPTDSASATDAQVLFARGMGQWGLGAYDEAAVTLDAALESAQSLGWLNLQSYVLNWAAVTASRRRDPRRSLEFARVRVDLETAWGREKELAAGLHDLATAQRETGDPAGGRRTLERALAVSRERDDAAALQRALLAMASVCVEVLDHPAAARYAREAVDHATQRKSQRDLAFALSSLGAVLLDSGEAARARSFLARAAGLAREEKMTTGLGKVLGQLASSHVALGEFSEAVSAYDEAIQILHSSGDWRAVAFVLNNMAALHHKMGRTQNARARLEEARKIFEKQRYPIGVASTSTSLAELAMGRGEFDLAKRLLQRAMELHVAAWNRRGEASVLASLATLANYGGQYDEAAGLFERSLALYAELNEVLVQPMVRSNLGWTRVQQGRVEEGIALMESAIDDAYSFRDLSALVDLKAKLAEVFLLEDDLKRAQHLAGEALDHREVLLGGLSDDEAVDARAHLNMPAEIGALAAARLGDAAKTLRFLEAGRAGLLLESLGGRDALQWADLPPELVEAEQRAHRAQGEAAARLRRAAVGSSLKERRAAREALDQATSAVRNAVVRIQREAKAQAGLLYPRPTTIPRIQKILGSSEALVIYGSCHGEAIAVVVTRRSARVALLGDATPLDDACAVFRSLSADVESAPALKTLAERLVKPLKLGVRVNRVIFSPSGPLTYVPVSALFPQATSVTPSATTLVLQRGEPVATGRGVLALGDPQYAPGSEAPTGFGVRGGALTPLPATREEVKLVGDVVLVGEKATEAGLRKAISERRRWRAVHFACHGLVDPARPMMCALALTPTDEEDGFLSALEVFRQKIPADLAVLSACETGQGRVVRGEGLLGLVRAFLYAGAPRVIASLWRVDDEATRALMVKFYDLWNPDTGKGLPAAEALRGAQEHVRAQPKWKHPYYWAAWVLWGLPD